MQARAVPLPARDLSRTKLSPAAALSLAPTFSSRRYDVDAAYRGSVEASHAAYGPAPTRARSAGAAVAAAKPLAQRCTTPEPFASLEMDVQQRLHDKAKFESAKRAEDELRRSREHARGVATLSAREFTGVLAHQVCGPALSPSLGDEA